VDARPVSIPINRTVEEGRGLTTMFETLPVGEVVLPNRIMQTAHSKGFADYGLESPRDLAYYLERARGGVGLLIAGGRGIDPSTLAPPAFSSGYVAGVTAADRKVTEAVHRYDTKIFAQTNHFGVNSPTDGIDELHELISASDVPAPTHGKVPRPMEEADMVALEDNWAHAAELVREGGYDGVEILMAHGYLLHQFFSPLYNKRTDEYGGSVANRARLAGRVLRAVRARVGDDFTVGVRMSLGDFVPGGLELDDVIGIGRELAGTARVDFFNMSGPGYHAFFLSIPPVGGPPDGWLAEASGTFRAAIGETPVFLVGGIRRPEQVAAILDAGQADVVALTREQLAEPEWVEKVRTGREDEITHCIRANQGCFTNLTRASPIHCTVNPDAGRESIFRSRRGHARERRSWLVVGGGPAGMKAAATLAKRGHAVTLAERTARLGGQVNLLLRAPGREDIGLLVSDLESELERRGVDVRLGTDLDAAAVEDFGADRVLLATGARPDRRGFSTWNPSALELEGADEPHVLTGWDVLEGADVAPGPVAVLDDDGGRYAASVTELLLAAGHPVEHVTTRPMLFPDTVPTLEHPVIYARVLAGPITVHLNTWVRSVRGGRVAAYNLYTGAAHPVGEVATVVLVTQRRAEDTLHRQLGGRHLRLGDCLAPRALDHAIFDGYVAGLEMDRSELPDPGELQRRWDLLDAGRPTVAPGG
jgi:2,4-dienoyl-CoA reductase-like NADH-dependent reductase (Old Yellow Enzyme family)